MWYTKTNTDICWCVMKIYKNICELKDKPVVLALGDFDGVHTGHCSILSEAVKLSRKIGCEAGVYTFEVNSKYLLGAKNLSFLTTEVEKNHIFESLGIDFICYDDFTIIKGFSPEKFCDYLIENTGVRALICGENYTFGKNAAAGSRELKEIMSAKGVECVIVSDYQLSGVTVSSTAIRNLIMSGDVESAREMLGYRYFIESEVVHGAGLGRNLGFPTINQLPYGNKTVPAYGVYCCKCTIDGKEYLGIVNVGVKPTVSTANNSEDVLFETNIFDYTGDLYGKNAKIEFYKMLRPEIKFETVEALKKQVFSDIEKAREYFGKENI